MNISNLKDRIRHTEPPVQPDIKRVGTDFLERSVVWNPYNIKNGAIFRQFTVRDDCDPIISLIPDACAEIVFTCDQDNAKAEFYGVRTVPQELRLQNNATVFCFKPYTLVGTKLGNIQQSELLNTSLDLVNIFSNTDIAERIAEASSFDERIMLFQNFAMEKMLDANFEDDISELMAVIMCLSKGNARISEIKKIMGFTEQYCRKMFKAQYGFSPKTYGRMLRLQKTLTMMSSMLTKNYSLTDIAYESGYSDVAHFIREFGLYTNMTPKQYKQTYLTPISNVV